ncbi:hypothetical protein ALC60_11076 [Trachymyrmex zeteki]|uniref:Uncharacterized protein n=1 Tax=Mycetomoellerius zeteki TaxID=64791 RepID=A0A151WQ19_9HYME|nr:hypothetical protein ALC60_11076 [Trachymyrmex zeteki]
MWTRFDVFEYLISFALKPSHHSHLITVQTLAIIEVELTKDGVTSSCMTDRFLIAEEKEETRREAEREEERKRESELNRATRGRVSILECTCRGNKTRTTSKPRKRERERKRDALHAAAHAVLCKLRQGPDQTCRSDSYRARNAPKLAKRQRLLPDAMTTMVRAAVLAAVLGQLLGPSVASRPAGAHPGHAYFEQPCCGRSHLRHHKAGNEMPVSIHHQYYLGKCPVTRYYRGLERRADFIMVSGERERERTIEWNVEWSVGRSVARLVGLVGWFADCLASWLGYGSRVLESIAGFPNGKYYNRCYGGDSRQGQLMLRNGRPKRPGITPPNDLYRRT